MFKKPVEQCIFKFISLYERTIRIVDEKLGCFPWKVGEFGFCKNSFNDHFIILLEAHPLLSIICFSLFFFSFFQGAKQDFPLYWKMQKLLLIFQISSFCSSFKRYKPFRKRVSRYVRQCDSPLSLHYHREDGAGRCEHHQQENGDVWQEVVDLYGVVRGETEERKKRVVFAIRRVDLKDND